MKEMKKLMLSASAVLALGSVSSVAMADEGFSVFSNTKFNGEIRPRYENVDVDNSGKKQANAYTVRATIGMESTLFGVDGLTVKIDGTTVQEIGGNNFNSSANGLSGYELVKDPEQSRFSQLYLQYKMGNTTAKAGKQIVNLDNQRFVGSVDWRQMMQSFEAAVLSNTSIPGLTLIGGYVWGVDGIGNTPTAETDSVLFNGSYKVNDTLKITAYDYMISSTHDTVGAALTGVIPAAGAKVDYRAEYAVQGDASRDTDGGTVNAQADAYYYNLEATATMNGVIAGVGYEFLSGTSGSDGKSAFSTPLATLHKFNGWADIFLTTPTGGLVDTSLTLGYGAAGLGKAMVVYHDFETDVAMSGKSDLGSEWDMMYTNAIPGIKGLNGLIKAAYFNGGDVAGKTADVRKVWLQLDYKF